MNDFEDRLRRTPLHLPPPEWRDKVLAASAHRSWREEVWPSVSAWAALAAVWVVLVAVERFTAPPEPVRAPAPAVASNPPPRDSVVAFHSALNSATSYDFFR